MSVFSDKDGREWRIKLDVGLIEDIAEKTDIDFDMLIKEPSKLAEAIFSGPREIVRVLYVCCEEQIEKVPLTPREFGRL